MSTSRRRIGLSARIRPQSSRREVPTTEPLEARQLLAINFLAGGENQTVLPDAGPAGSGQVRIFDGRSLLTTAVDGSPIDFNKDGRTDQVALGVEYLGTSTAGKTNSTLGQAMATPIVTLPDGKVQPVAIPGSPGTFGRAATGAVVADLDGDGTQDLLLSRDGGGMTAYHGVGDGTFTLLFDSSTAPGFKSLGFAGGFAAGDFDGDGLLDVVGRSAVGGQGLDVYRGVGSGGVLGGFQATPYASLGTGFTGLTDSSLVVADLNRDGHPDVVATTATGIGLFLNDGHGGFPTTPTATLASADGNPGYSILAADLNNDGKADLVSTVGTSGLAGTSSLVRGPVNVYLNTTATAGGAATFSASSLVPGGSSFVPGSLAVGNFDLDGRLYLAIGDAGSLKHFAVARGLPSGGFATATEFVGVRAPAGFASPIGSAGLAVGDLNGDNMPDVAQGGRLINAQGASAPATSYAVALSLNTTYPPLQVETSTFTKPVAGVPYQAYLSATGGAESDILTASISLSPDSPPLPDGLRIDNGQITGTATTPGTYHFVLRYEQVLAPNSIKLTGDTPVTLEVLPPPDETFTILPATLEPVERYTPYLQLLTPVGSIGDVRYRLASGEPPDGITVSINGQIGGVPQVTGTYHFVVEAQDSLGRTASIAYTLEIPPVQAGDLTITPDTLQSARQGSAYSQQIAASGGTGDITYALTDGALPAGLTLSADGLLSGTSSVAGTFQFDVTATDSTGVKGTHAYTLAVGESPMGISPTSLEAGHQGEPYSRQLVAYDGNGAVTFALAHGDLPPGLTISPDGLISGTPTAANSYVFSVSATDSASVVVTRMYPLQILPGNPPSLTISPATLGDAKKGAAYEQQLVADGASGSATFRLTDGGLPAGLTLSAAGKIGGTPTASGSFPFSVTATDASGASTTKAFTLAVLPADPVGSLTLSPAEINAARQGEAYSQKIKATGGTGSVTFALVAGKLPAGLTLSQNGTIAGLPLVSGTFPISLTAKDSTGKTGSIAYSLVVKTAEPLSITPTTLDAGQVGEDYSQILSVKSGAGAPTFAIIAGALPSGLILTQDGVIVGTPTIAGAFGFTVGVSLANGSSGSQSYALDVQPAAVPVVVPPSVIDLARYGSNGGKSYLVVTYDREMDSTSAGWTGNYTLRKLGRDGIAGTRDDRIIPLVTAAYASANHSVTLAPRGRLQLGNHRYQLVISSSVMSATGVRLDGNGSGVPGTSYTRTFGAEILRGKTPPTITPPGRTPTPRRHLGRGR